MATHLVVEFPPPCPGCGRRMAVIEVVIRTPPYVFQLAGCEQCGVTSNEPRTTPTAGAMRYEYRRR